MSQEEATAWFNAVYREQGKQLFAQAMRRLNNNKDLAEELVQETFALFWEKLHELCDHPNLPGWLSITLRNLIHDKTSSASYCRELPMEAALGCSAEEPPPDPEEVLPAGLNKRDREVLILRYVEDLPYEEIARRMHISVPTSRARVSRAKRRCKTLLEREKRRR